MFTVTQVNNRFRGLVKCGHPFDGALVLGPAGACAFQPSTSPRWMEHLVMVMGGNRCFWDYLDTYFSCLFSVSLFFFFFFFFLLLLSGVLNKLQNQKKKVGKRISNATG